MPFSIDLRLMSMSQVPGSSRDVTKPNWDSLGRGSGKTPKSSQSGSICPIIRSLASVSGLAVVETRDQ